MAEERSGGRERKGRRRYFRPKKNSKENPGQPQPPQSAKPAESKNAQGRNRKARRRARSRQRGGDEQKVVVTSEPDVAYVPPKESFIYTYAAHPEMRDAYEFRPEHFSRVGRTLADYQIDLAKLFPENADALPLLVNPMATKGFDWSDWEEENSDKAAKGENHGA
jgi:hypothetical protein